MKKLKIFVVLLLSITLVACSNNQGSNKNDTSTNTKNDTSEQKNSPIVDDELNKIDANLKEKKTFIFIASTTTCGACISYLPTLEDFKNNNKNIQVINVKVDTLKDKNLAKKFIMDYQVEYTPTTIFVKDGKIASSQTGSMPEENLKKLADQYLK